MKIAVLFKAVPDLVEDIALDEESGEILYDDMSYVPSEWDDQALEEALLIKEESGGEVTAITVDTGDSDNMLYTALAKGADHAVKLVGDFDPSLSNRSRAQILSEYIRQQDFDLVLSGVQAIDDIDGQIPGLVAGILGWPHASVVTEVHVTGNTVILRQEYAGGVVAEIQTPTPVVMGIQAARKPPRYASIAKVRQVAKSAQIEEVDMAMPTVPQLEIRRFYKPVAAGHAEMIDGDVDEVAARIIEILQERNLVRR
ncbi:electron transfer flavoprotein subunit beta/FixA family protein [Sulfobacillus thermosulfidooxidans]|uniref:electron transfer flavoprotein subunit beta/FixA family protein n=1 Tax=Sulfobacillus thermosulfidooxidans TaxID=28034 RepID=UPI00096B9908|nr:electron transfer flavoprotein subunit beta [Sulfobacillus thermosulfidooxidans]OLZ12167.1 electron transfer flavoprotein subunit beta [Sulfobacillus thermosulfidooxidans]OLZ13053.1 electron transfer flavoprotein subunit beta [Sulfobacillus thermosulfidooxidans]OLZ21433.1 electron transfer flavoprotein subunit beta [Sulfobacillus thermosulfidooxidans]